MNMHNHFKLLLMTFIIATLATISIACSNPRPEMQGPTKSNVSFCDDYKMQEIYPSDSNNERIKKLQENTYFHGVCTK